MKAKTKKKNFYIQSFIKKGLTYAEACDYWDYHEKVNFNTIDRKWREFCDPEDKDRVSEEKYRSEYSPANKVMKDYKATTLIEKQRERLQKEEQEKEKKPLQLNF